MTYLKLMCIITIDDRPLLSNKSGSEGIGLAQSPFKYHDCEVNFFMQSRTSSDYISNRAWLRDIISGDDLILCGVSALEYLELFVGYANEKNIDVYAKKEGKYSNVNYHVVDSFENIDFIQDGNLLCTSLSQTINDMLSDFDNTDEMALTEALSNYYYSNGESFDGLLIKPENLTNFQSLVPCAIDYYSGG